MTSPDKKHDPGNWNCLHNPDDNNGKFVPCSCPTPSEEKCQACIGGLHAKFTVLADFPTLCEKHKAQIDEHLVGIVTPTPSAQEGWKEDFAKHLGEYEHHHKLHSESFYEWAVKFIRRTIETAIKEERERVAGEVEKMKVLHQEFENNVGKLHCDPVTEICEITAHNQALTDVLSIINTSR
jgi:hypothetical protein